MKNCLLFLSWREGLGLRLYRDWLCNIPLHPVLVADENSTVAQELTLYKFQHWRSQLCKKATWANASQSILSTANLVSCRVQAVSWYSLSQVTGKLGTNWMGDKELKINTDKRERQRSSSRSSQQVNDGGCVMDAFQIVQRTCNRIPVGRSVYRSGTVSLVPRPIFILAKNWPGDPGRG